MYLLLVVFPNWTKTQSKFCFEHDEPSKEWEENRNPADDAGIVEARSSPLPEF